MADYAHERHRRILEFLKMQGEIRCADLEVSLGVTPMTVWRDLKLLEERGQLRRVRGGAMANTVADELDYTAKSDRARAAKQRIASYVAANCIDEGDILILDGGTTIASLRDQALPGGLTILTNSLPVAQALLPHVSRPTVYVSGGLLRPESGTMVGREAATFFSRRRAAKFLLTATAVDVGAGVTDPNPQEIEVKQAMASRAEKIILLSDTSKFGEVSHMQTLPWRRIDHLITNREHMLTKAMRAKGLNVSIA
ncbi:MAG: DeoR/GlpR family DNA-binding transcription regulator [Verrucomicrobiota bacterium]